MLFPAGISAEVKGTEAQAAKNITILRRGVVMFRKICRFRTGGQGLYEITDGIEEAVSQSGIEDGMCNIFIEHTSASLCIQENADPSARADLETFMKKLVPSQDWFTHTAEGADDMPSHIKTALTSVSLDVPVVSGRLALGVWQGIYLWEHRSRSQDRRVMITVWD